MQLTEISLNKQLKAIVEKLQTNPEFQEKEIIWSLESSLLIKTKEQMLQKVLQNIVNNAFLYSQKKGKIKITTKQLDNYWYCSIYNTTSTDSLKNELTKLFEPFYRLEKSGNKNTGGSGLGLFLVKQFLSNLNIKYEFKIIEDGVLFEIWGNS
ncbi:ATP-binding protein [Enterococcus faecalis]|uniref:ATP-binding protein n=2 Tax=Enterococcus faecalis TaxID=1351 RepID=UPI003D6C020A